MGAGAETSGQVGELGAVEGALELRTVGSSRSASTAICAGQYASFRVHTIPLSLPHRARHSAHGQELSQ